MTSTKRDTVGTMKTYIGFKGIAQISGIEVATVRSYNRYGLLPTPDAVIDGRPGWDAKRIETWQANRPAPNKRPPARVAEPQD